MEKRHGAGDGLWVRQDGGLPLLYPDCFRTGTVACCTHCKAQTFTGVLAARMHS